jgi:WXXGXW repeat (2 copies)
MPRATMPSVRFILPALSALLLSACVVAPYAPAHSTYDEPGATSEVPPPPPQVEVVPVLPFAGAIWLSGYWGWGGGRYHWVPGRWDRPRVGFMWAPHRWVPFHGRWQLRGGWHRR